MLFIAPSLLLLASAAFAPQDPPPSDGPVNSPPVCFATFTTSVPCGGQVTTVLLDASSVFDPDGDPMTFEWTTGCPGFVIEDSTAQVTNLHIDTSVTCDVQCSVRLRIGDGQTASFCRFFIEVENKIEAKLDVKPGFCPNKIDVKDCGIVPVALLGTANFDVRDVDFATVSLEREDGVGTAVKPCWKAFWDVAKPFEGALCGCNATCGDGIEDLLMLFDEKALIKAFSLKLVANNTNVTLVLTGFLKNGTPFCASDCIRVQNNGCGNNNGCHSGCKGGNHSNGCDNNNGGGKKNGCKSSCNGGKHGWGCDNNNGGKKNGCNSSCNSGKHSKGCHNGGGNNNGGHGNGGNGNGGHGGGNGKGGCN